MNGPADNGRYIRKIAVAFDPACATPALLEAAADLAVSFGAELEALFVEDPDIARLSQLPFGRIARPMSGKLETFDAPALLSMRAGPTARFRAALRQLAEARRFAYSVHEVRGRALAEAATESEAELLVIASFHGKFGGARSVDEEARQFAAISPRSVLLASQLPISTHRLLVVADESERGTRAEAIARAILRRDPLHDAPEIGRMVPESKDAAALAERIRAASPTLVIVGLSDAAFISALFDLLSGDGISLLIVR